MYLCVCHCVVCSKPALFATKREKEMMQIDFKRRRGPGLQKFSAGTL